MYKVAKQTIDNYLNKKLDDWSWIKELSREDLENEILHYFKDFKPIFKPFTHQLASILLGILNENFCFFLPMGLGKTFVSVELMKYHFSRGRKKALVLVPNDTNVWTWLNEIKKTSVYEGVGLVGPTKQKEKLLYQNSSNIYVINYTGLSYLVSSKKKGKLQIDEEKIDRLKDYIDMIFFDEIHVMVNETSLISRVCKELTKSIDVRHGLTGTPFGRNPLMLWNQVYFVDQGATLGEKSWLFKEAFFNKKQNYFGGVDYKFKKALTETLSKKLRNVSIRYETENCVDLPPLNFVKESIGLADEIKVAYDSIIEGKDEIGNIFHKLRKTCSGYSDFVTEDGERTISQYLNNPKVEKLLELIDLVDGKCVVFNYYISTGDLLENVFRDEKIDYGRIYGEVSGKKRQVILDRFQNNKNCKVLLCSPDSGGTGTNLQIANYCFYFESPSDPISRQQSEKRLHRPGQTKPVFIYDIFIKNSIEEKILRSLKDGKDLFDEIIKTKNLNLLR